MNTTEFTKAITCKRCSGTGMVGGPVVVAGIPGACFKCQGLGKVEGDRATIAAAKKYVAERTELGRAALAAGTEAHFGLGLLERNEPARCRKAVASFIAGDPRVIPALVAYGKGA